MPGVYVGDTKCLVFPMMCDGYIKQEYLNTNPANTDLELREGHWGIDEFTIEAIITPYDVNGYGVKTGSGSGITDSEKTAPSLAQAVSSNLTSYQSYQYFGASHGTVPRLTHKMMLYWNQNFELYLENTTLSNSNQPAEYKIVAKIHQDDITKGTVETEAIIKANNMLHGYYDANGLYDGMTTSKTKLSADATASGNVITIDSGESANLANVGIGEKIYNSSGLLIGTISSISGVAITLTGSPSNMTTSIYVSQKREALYIEST